MEINQAFKDAEVTKLREITGSNEDGTPIYGDDTGAYEVRPDGIDLCIAIEASSKADAITKAKNFYLGDPIINPEAEPSEG